MQIRQIRRLLIPDMPPALQPRRRAPGNQNRQILVIVQTRIPHTAPIQIHRMVQQRPLPVLRRLHPLQKLRKQRDVISVDLRNLGHLKRVIPMVARRMMRIPDANLRIRPVALLPRKLERNHPRNISLKRQYLQVEHQLRMIGKRRRHPHRPLQIRSPVLRHPPLGPRNLFLHRMDALQILLQPGFIRPSHAPFQLRNLGRKRIQ